MNKKFDFIVIEPADNNRDKNGNNGNYDKVAVFYDGKLVTTNIVSDYTTNDSDFVRVNDQKTYGIVGGRIIFTNFGDAKDITEAVKNGEHPIFRRGFEYLVEEYEEMYKEAENWIRIKER